LDSSRDSTHGIRLNCTVTTSRYSRASGGDGGSRTVSGKLQIPYVPKGILWRVLDAHLENAEGVENINLEIGEELGGATRGECVLPEEGTNAVVTR
jgi:hypothetical protein